MKVSSRTDTGTSWWLAFLAAAVAICMAFGIMGIASGAALAAPESSSSAAADLIASSTSTEATEDAAAVSADANAGTEWTGVLPIGDDVLMANDNIQSSDQTVKANLFAAGNQIDLEKTSTGADAFVAGDVINISGMTAMNNVFIAGNNITVNGTTAKTVFAAGNNLDLATDATDLNAAGRTIFLKGTYEGNVSVNANSVVIDPYIVVKGTLDVTASQEPTIASTAKIGEYKYSVLETDTGATTNIINTDFSSIGSPEWVQQLIWTLVMMLVLGVVMLLVLRTEVVDSMGRLTRNRPVAILITGLLSLIIMPVIILGLLILIASAPISALLFLIGVCIVIFANAYTAIALGRTMLPRVNKWVTSIIMLLVFGLLASLPVVSFIISVLCCIYAFGSVIQGWWVWRRGKDLSDEHEDEYGQGEFTVPRGEHYATGQTGAVASSPAVPSNLGQAVDSPLMPDEPRGW